MQYLSNLIWGTSLTSITPNIEAHQLADPAKNLELPSLPGDVWKVIFSDVNYKEFQTCSVVNKQWNDLTNDPILSKEVIYKDFCFNLSHWNVFCGPDTVSNDEIKKAWESLPKNIDEILKSPCPASPGKKVKDTHMLVWISETIKGKPVTIDSFGQLLKERPEFFKNQNGYQSIWNSIVQQEGSNTIKSGWVLMTTDVLPGSRYKSYDTQKALVENLNESIQLGYRVPKTVEAIACMVAEYLRSGKRLFSDAPWTYTRCQENVQGHQVAVGGFAPAGLHVIHPHAYGCIGVAGLRKF